MAEKMSFWEKLMYRAGLKDPEKIALDPKKASNMYEMTGEASPSGKIQAKKKIFTPLEEAVRSGDFERLDFFKKYVKLSQAALVSALTLVPSAAVLRKLETMGAQVKPDMLPVVVRSISSYMTKHRCSSDDYRQNAKFFRESGVSMNFHDTKGRSLYDAAPSKEDWFNIANPAEIGHEFRHAVAHGNIEKVKEMLEIGKDKVDVNSMNPQRFDAMNYALRLPEEQSEQMARLLFDHGAKLNTVDGNGQNALQRAKPNVREMLIEETIRQGNISGLDAIEDAGIELYDPKYLLMTTNVNVLVDVARLGASVEDALQVVRGADENTWGSEQNVAHLRALLEVQKILGPEDNQTGNSQSLSSSVDKRQAALAYEFRQAVADRNYSKVQDIIDNNDDNTFDINAVSKQGRSAISYAYRNDDLKMAFILYHNGAKLDGDELYKNASVRMRNMLAEQCEQQRDVAGIDAIMQCVNSKDPSNWEDRHQVRDNAYEYNRLKRIKEDIMRENASTGKGHSRAANSDVVITPRSKKSKINEETVISAVERGDLNSLDVAVNAGMDFDNPKYWDAAKTKDVMEFIVEHRKKPITQQEVSEARQADINDEYGYYNDPNRTAHNKFLVLREAFIKQQEKQGITISSVAGKNSGRA